MAASKLSLADLPVDILSLIFCYLDVKDFLAVCSTNKALWSFHADSGYWRPLTRFTFRLPNQPLLQADGTRWKWLYKQLATRSRVFTWGSNDCSCLGHSPRRWETLPGSQTRLLRSGIAAPWPTEMIAGRNPVGVVVDVQCGGWSTTFLNSKGVLFCCGKINGLQFLRLENMTDLGTPRPLLFPPGYLSAEGHNDPGTAIAQFSSGRSHVLGLADSGTVWLWADSATPSRRVRFFNIDLNDSQISSTPSHNHGNTKRVKKVVAGWDRSSAYVSGTGIALAVLPVTGLLDCTSPPSEAVYELQVDMDIIPSTGYCRPQGNARDTSWEAKELGQTVGEVINYVLLEGYAVIVTDLGKVFAANTANSSNISQGLFELTTLAANAGEEDPKFSDVQGSFRSFAAFTRGGHVVVGSRDYLDYAWNTNAGIPTTVPSLPKYYPAMQQQDVISVAFGDYHIHALHSNGQVSSFGTEPRSCGALGLGGQSGGSWLRGVSYSPGNIFHDYPGSDCSISPERFSYGRRIWFEPEKKEWLHHMSRGGSIEKEKWEQIYARWSQAAPEVKAELVDWFEQMGAGWDEDLAVHGDEDSAFGAYFVLSIAAAGWHSGSLVLVNEELKRKIKDKCTVTKAVETGPGDGAVGSFSVAGSVIPWLYHLARRFLGLERTVNSPVENNAPAPSSSEDRKYSWSGDPFPRIKLSTGEIIGEEGPIWERKDGVFVRVAS